MKQATHGKDTWKDVDAEEEYVYLHLYLFLKEKLGLGSGTEPRVFLETLPYATPLSIYTIYTTIPRSITNVDLNF